MTQRNKILAILIFLILALPNHNFGQNTLTKEILWTTDWSPNGKYVAVAGNIDTLKIYSERNLELYKFLPVKNTITRIKWHPSINIMAVTTQMSDEKSFIIDIETNQKTELSGISQDGARGLDWNYTGEYLAVADNDGQILIYDTKGKFIRKFMNENTKAITAIDWHSKKNTLVAVSDKIRFFDIDGNLLKSIQHRQEEVMLLSVAWHKSGDFFVTGDYGTDKSILQYWNVKRRAFKNH